jgi:small conductance mechanosensitive channel
MLENAMNDWLSASDMAPWLQMVSNVSFRLLGALIVLLVGLRIARRVASLIEHALHRTQIDRTAAAFLARTARVGLQIILILAVVQILGVPMSSMFAILGAAGLAIGLALKDSLSNIASGVLLLVLRPFKVGDVITAQGVTGTVEAIGVFQTRLRGGDNQTMILPNAQVTTANIINLTPDTMRRVEIVIGIGYDDDIDKARAIALGIMSSDSRVLPQPAADVLVYELAASSVNLGIRCHVGNNDFFAVKCDLLERIKKGFDAAGISIPFPQQDAHVYVHPTPSSKTPG